MNRCLCTHPYYINNILKINEEVGKNVIQLKSLNREEHEVTKPSKNINKLPLFAVLKEKLKDGSKRPNIKQKSFHSRKNGTFKACIHIH